MKVFEQEKIAKPKWAFEFAKEYIKDIGKPIKAVLKNPYSGDWAWFGVEIVGTEGKIILYGLTWGFLDSGTSLLLKIITQLCHGKTNIHELLALPQELEEQEIFF